MQPAIVIPDLIINKRGQIQFGESLLAELTFSIYLGQKDQENMAAIFLAAFVPMVIVTLVLARVFVRKMGK